MERNVNTSSSTSKQKNKKGTNSSNNSSKPKKKITPKPLIAKERKQACLFILSDKQIKNLKSEFCLGRLCDEIMAPVKNKDGSFDESSAAYPVFRKIGLKHSDLLPEMGTKLRKISWKTWFQF